jgi:hypothetical protein
MRLYTFFFQYKELTHVHQFNADSKEDALQQWSKAIQATRIDDADTFFGKTIAEEVHDRLTRQGLTPRDNLTNVWCCTFLFEDNAFGDLNITITEGSADT